MLVMVDKCSGFLSKKIFLKNVCRFIHNKKLYIQKKFFSAMRKIIPFFLVLSSMGCSSSGKVSTNANKEFPDGLVHFVPYKNNPVFAATGTATWDDQIRERGWILKE